MRVNVYAEEMTHRLEIVKKVIDGHAFTGLRFYLYLPVTLGNGKQVQGAFIHRDGDDDSSAVTFWGKRDLRMLLRKALEKLDHHYGGESDAAGSAKRDLREAARRLYAQGMSVDQICDEANKAALGSKHANR